MSTTLFKLQDNVPLPDIDRAPQTVRRKFPVEQMQVGQMFFLPGRSSRSVSAYVSRITKDLPGKFSVRRCWAMKRKSEWAICDQAEKGAVSGVGVWRVE